MVATLETPVWMQNGTFASAQDRTLVDNLWGTDGVINVGDLAVSQRAAGTNLSVDIASGVGVCTGDDTPAQGKYLVRHLNGPTNVALTTAPGTGLSRIDLIVARIQDAAVIGGSNNNFIFDKVTGTSASTPSAPALPDSCLLLAQVLVGANVTVIVNANITDQRRRAWNMSGGTAICTSTTRPASPWAGLTAVETDTGRLVVYTGSAWTTLASMGNAHVRAHRAAAWNSTAGQFAFGFDTEDWDQSNNYSTSTFLFVPVYAGFYRFSARAAVVSTAAGQFVQWFLRQNNVQVDQGSTGIATATGQNIDTVLPGVTLKMAAGDNAELFLNCSTLLTGITGTDAAYLTIDQVG